MSPPWEFACWLAFLVAAIAYAFWRGFRMLAFQEDLVALRQELHEKLGPERIAADRAAALLDLLLYGAVEYTESLALFDFTLIHLANWLGWVDDLDSPEYDVAPLLASTVAPEVRDLSIRAAWRLGRYAALESISGFACAVGWVLYAGFLTWPAQKPVLKGLATGLTGLVSHASAKRRGREVVVH